MAHIVGIDIGADSIKAALFEGSLGRYNLKGFQEEVIPDGEEPLDERQDRALENLIGSLPKDTRSYVAYPYHKLSSKHVTLPFTDQKKVEQTLAFYIEDQIPFDIDEVILSHRVLEIKEKDTDIFLAVCPKNALQQNLDRLSAMNINPEMLPIDADLLGNCCTEDYEIIIDIGHSRVLCVLTKESKAILVRSLRHGVGQFHDVIREHH
ncbi:MAG: type II secretion system protein GspL [Myxococcota bacterium]|nr:type II secretion system protein GspL [Myxococcota bacterium]